MATKQLEVVVTATDRLSANMRTMLGSVVTFGSGAVRVGSALESAVKRNMASILNLKTLLGGVAVAAAAYKLVGVFGDTVEKLDEMSERAREFGLSVEHLSVFEYAAKRANVPADELANALKKGTTYLGELAQKGGQLQNIGDLIEQMAISTAEMTQPERLAAFKEVFGKSAEAIERMTGNGRLSGYRKDLEALGGVITTTQVAAASRVSDAIDRVSTAWFGVKTAFVVSVAEPVENLLNAVAYRLARVPDQVRAAIYAIGEAVRGGPAGQAAAAALSQFRSATFDVIKTLVSEGAKLLFVAVKESLILAVRAAAPYIGDVINDIRAKYFSAAAFLPKDALAVLKTAGIEPSTKLSDYGQLRELREQAAAQQQQMAALAGMQERARDLAAMIDNAQAGRENPSDRRGRPSVQDMSTELQGLRSRIDEVMSSRTVLVRLREQEAAVAAIEIERGRQFAADAVDSFGAISQAVQDAKNNVAGSMAAFDEAGKAITDLYKAANPPEQLGGRRNELADWWAAMRGRFNVMIADTGEIRSRFGEAWRKLLDQMSEGRDVLAQLEGRGLKAGGEDAAAQRMEMVNAQWKERAELIAKLGSVASQAMPALRQVQAAELSRLDAEQGTAAITAAAAEAQKRYTDAVGSRSAMVQAGLIDETGAQRQNVAALQELIERTRESARALQELGSTGAGAAAVVKAPLEEVTERVKSLGFELMVLQEQVNNRGDFWAGFKRGMKDVVEQAQQFYEQGRALFNNIAGVLSNGVADAIVAVIDRTKSAKEAFRDMAASVLSDIGRMILQMLAFRAVAGITAAIGGISMGGGTAWAGGNVGGAGLGGGVAMASPAPFVGGAGLARAAAPAPAVYGGGAGGGGVNITTVINIGGGGATDAKAMAAIQAAAAHGVMAALDTNPAMRERMRRRLA